MFGTNPHLWLFEHLPRVEQLERIVRTLEGDLESKRRANEASQRRIEQLEEALGRDPISLLDEIGYLKRVLREQGEYIAALTR